MFHVYGLVDPRDGVIRYVGCSVNPKARLTWHVFYNQKTLYRPTRRDLWIADLRKAGLRPSLRILFSHANARSASDEEARLIAAGGEALTNGQKGAAYIDQGVRLLGWRKRCDRARAEREQLFAAAEARACAKGEQVRAMTAAKGAA